jgi:hypothetical protein
MSALSFAHPALIAGVLGVAAPIIIHFIFRRRSRRIEFSAMRFVLLAYKKIARRLILQEYLLLMIRVLIAALLALALAGPRRSFMQSGINRGEKPLAVAFILDPSFSMSRARNGKTLLAASQDLAAEWLARLVKGDRAGVLDSVRLAGLPPTSDLAAARKGLADVKPASAPARLPEAVAAAAGQLADLPGMDRMIVIFTDLQRVSFAGNLAAKGDLPMIYVVDIAEGLPLKNLSVSGLDIKSQALAREEAVAITSSVSNFGEDDARQALIRVQFGDEIAAQGFVDVGAGKSVQKSFSLTEIPEGPGMVRLQADDGLTADNQVYFNLRGGQEVRALVVDGDPRQSYLDAETYFLDQALNPRLYTRSRISPRTVTVPELAAVKLTDYGVLVLANVESLPPEQIQRIKTFVQNGGGLLFTLGDRVNADDYDAAWDGILPRELRGVKLSFAGAQAGGEIKLMHLAPPALGQDSHPLLSIFRDPAQGDLSLAGFWKYFLMQQEVLPRTRVILKLTDGTPILVEGNYGQGRVIVFASTADRAWNDLCIHPTFLPLFQQTVQYLGRALVREDTGRLMAGSVVEIPVGSEVTGAKVKGPDQEVFNAELMEESGGRKAIRVGRTDRPGFYLIQFTRPGENQGLASPFSRPDHTLILNVNPAESDLARLPAEEIESMMKPNARVITPNQPLDPGAAAKIVKKPYAGQLLMLLVALAIAERVLTRKG